MRQQQYVWISLLTLGMASPAFANESAVDSSTRTTAEADSSAATSKAPSRLESLKELKILKHKIWKWMPMPHNRKVLKIHYNL